MNRRLLNKIVQPHVSRWQVCIANAGLILGLAGLLLSVQLYSDFAELFRPSKAGDGDHLIINKGIGFTDSLMMKSPTFTDREIDILKKQPFVRRLGKISRNTFPVQTSPAGPLQIQTEFFLESVPVVFLDEVPDQWTWQEGDDTIPAIMSGEFLNLYNFVYAPSQGLPPVSRDALKMLSLPIRVGGGDAPAEVRAKIVGYTDRIPSVLVPESFLNWANEKYGSQATPAPSRIIIMVDDPTDPAIAEYLQANRYQTNRDRLRKSRSAAAAHMAVVVTAIIGLLIGGLSVFSATMNAQLLIARSASAISLLIQLGYRRSALALWLMTRYIVSLAIVTMLAILLFRYALSQVHQLFLANGLLFPPQTTYAGYLALPILMVAAILLQFCAVQSGLKRSLPTKSV